MHRCRVFFFNTIYWVVSWLFLPIMQVLQWIRTTNFCIFMTGLRKKAGEERVPLIACRKRKTRFGTVDCWESGLSNPTQITRYVLQSLGKAQHLPFYYVLWLGVAGWLSILWDFATWSASATLQHRAIYTLHMVLQQHSITMFLLKPKAIAFTFFLIHENPSGNSNDERVVHKCV